MTAGDAAFERAGLDLLLDELDRRCDAVAHGPLHLSLDGDREVAPNVLEQRLVRVREVVWVRREPLHGVLAGAEHLTAVLEPRLAVGVRVDEVSDRPIDRA